MKITLLHLAFWYSRAAPPLPSWAQSLNKERPSVDALIDLQATFAHMAATSLLAILRSARKRGKLEAMLESVSVSVDSATLSYGARRQLYARKWLRRIRAGRTVSK